MNGASQREVMERLLGEDGQIKERSSPTNLREHSLWPTPRAQEPGSTSPDYSMGLAETARIWPTITAQDAKNNAGASQFQRNTRPLNVQAALHYFHPDPTVTGSASPLILNPAFTEWLMGWPIGWTGSEPAVMGWCHWWRRMRGQLSALVSLLEDYERLTDSALSA